MSSDRPHVAWKTALLPDTEGRSFVEVRDGDTAYRIPEAVWIEQPTCSPGGPGTPEHEAWLQAYVQYRPEDVVIATYPKCGTTLMEQIVLLLLNGGHSDALDPLTKNAANMHERPGKVWPEACLVPSGSSLKYPPGRPQKDEMVALELNRFDALPSPRVVKTHANVSRLLGRSTDGLPAAARYIVVSRNPLDACTSCYYHAWCAALLLLTPRHGMASASTAMAYTA